VKRNSSERQGSERKRSCSRLDTLDEGADVPPYPASHGCVRVPPPFAQELYEFASQGTVVVVT
jgi:hypothetical protein